MKHWDIIPPSPPETKAAEDVIETLIEELFRRGVTIEQIFGQFYEMEAIAHHRLDEIFGDSEAGLHGRQPLTVGDALLAGVAARPINDNPF